jgi:hypothetical protein
MRLIARTVAAFAASLRFWYPINHVGDVRARHAMARPHQGIAQRVPADERDAHSATVTDIDTQLIRRKPVLSGLINEYAQTA